MDKAVETKKVGYIREHKKQTAAVARAILLLSAFAACYFATIETSHVAGTLIKVWNEPEYSFGYSSPPQVVLRIDGEDEIFLLKVDGLEYGMKINATIRRDLTTWITGPLWALVDYERI